MEALIVITMSLGLHIEARASPFSFIFEKMGFPGLQCQ